MTNATNNEMREMAIEKMLEAIESAMADAQKTEKDALGRITDHVSRGILDSTDITNAADDVKAARAIQQALGEIAMWAQMAKMA